MLWQRVKNCRKSVAWRNTMSDGGGMSLEAPEIRIIATQLSELLGQEVTACSVGDISGLQPSGFANRDPAEYSSLVGGRIIAVEGRGNTIVISLDRGRHLVIGPEYGGRILVHPQEEVVPARHHLLLSVDHRHLSIRLTGMGCIRVESDASLVDNYVYQRDHLRGLDPLSSEFTREAFHRLIAGRPTQLKSALVGKEAATVGISNATFQDVLYRAGIHPKRRASELTPDEVGHLFEAVRLVMSKRIAEGGKTGFVDTRGTPGSCAMAMGPSHKDRPCPACGSDVEAVALGGGRVYFCPRCQT